MSDSLSVRPLATIGVPAIAMAGGYEFLKLVQSPDPVDVKAMALGIGEAALAAAIAYAKERKQFGHPIADFQGLQWMLADSRVELDAARLLLWRAATLADQGKPFSTEAAIAKLHASEAASHVCDRALQIHGGYGFINQFPVERYVRDVRLCRIGEGTSEVQRRVIARALLG